MKKTLLRITAKTLLVSMVYQLGFPLYSYALTSGPSQPEVQSFEPIGTTEMVDMFTGDFNYNIPLLDIEGYPVNISYHSGIGIEQEASWVGLGWNINPGNISRAVRGLPDDFNGETIDKELSIEEEKNFKIGTGISIGLELGGVDTRLSLGFKNYIQFNNYKGTSIGISTDASISLPFFNAGVGMGVGSQAGADIDLNAGFHIPKSVSTDMGPGGNGSIGTGFNSRTGMKDVSFGVNGTYNNTQMPLSFSGSIPIGLQNYVPVVTNPSSLSSFEFQARVGGELFYTFPNGYMSIQKSTMSFVKDGARPGYGYLYSENAPSTAITDFSRDRDGRYNKTMEHLPLSSMTYDVYSVSGQGTGGIFRPFRNDIGSIYDPEVKSPKGDITSVLTEAGIGTLFEVGTDISLVDIEANSGPWRRLNFRGNEQSSLYEKAFFKQGGELTYNNQQASGIFSDAPVYLAENMVTLKGKGGDVGSLPSKFGNAHVYNTGTIMDRTTRANLISYLTAEEATINDVAQDAKIRHYSKFGDTTSDTAFHKPGAAIVNDRFSAGKADRPQATHVSEFTQTLPDGRRYVYGIPAMNNLSREVTFSVSNSQADLETGLVGYDVGADDSKNNNRPKEKFYSSTTTPAYAHSYLLSSVLQTDYVDVLGDGPTDDDMGGWVKMNYTLWDNDYRWRTPYEGNKAQYNPGFWSDKQDDKGSYLVGSRQQWHVRSIESKNYVAEFYVSKRNDGRGVRNKIYNGSKYSFNNTDLEDSLTTAGFSYKLDSIRLFNKHDRYINGNSATPIKTVIFDYDYSLCNKIPNSNAPGTYGKLTLKRIYFKYGKSSKSLLSPYVFNYANANPDYNFADKDRWGNYKNHTRDGKLTNYEFPYTAQDGTNLDADKAPWNLTEISLPSGGKINVVYESDDYAFIQDKRTMQMFHIEGVGNSTKKDNQSKLYEDLNTVNDYLYFKRIPAKENRNLSMRDNYLEGTDYLYYSFALDISGTGKYEHMKGYAHIDALDKCSDDTSYCYIKIRKEHPGNHASLLHPATIYGVNNGRCYLQHIIYPGYLNGDEGGIQIGKALLDALGELGSIHENPIVRLVERKHIARDIDIDKSFIRLHRPGLTKKGGGIRVKQLTLSDSWQSLTNSTSNADADYGKNYSYTTESRYGTISSGVASYEPIVGGDENPFRMPVPYTAEGGRLLPKIEFFQETPFGESFFPPPVVGYSNVRVSSVHITQGRSSQSYEDYEFYTAKDYPIEIDYTDKEAPAPIKHSGLSKKTLEVKVFQGYALRFNDMHGKPKSITNTILKSNGSTVTPEPVSSVKYNYREKDGKLYNKVLALKRNRGTLNTYAIDSTTLGVETDFTVDTRERYNRTYKRNISMNLNVQMFGVFPVPIPTMFIPEKEETETFRSMVTTKIVQRYGILESVEKVDHGAVTKTQNVIFDSETGGVLLSKTNNEYNSDIYDLKYPAYWAYERMGPAYTNIGYEEKSDSLVIDPDSYYGKLHLDAKRFFAGDEVLLTYTDNAGDKQQVKAWVMEIYNPLSIPNTSPDFDPMNPYITPYWTNIIAYTYNQYTPAPSIPANTIWVALRASKNSSGASLWPGGLSGGDFVNNVVVKVIRSGRRNMLDKNVQQTVLADNPYNGSINDILGGTSASNAFNKVLSVNIQEYTDKAVPFGTITTDTSTYLAQPAGFYKPNLLPVDIDSAGVRVLNRYVLGHRGNFRPVREYVYIENRNYNNNVKTDGAYSIKAHPFWLNTNAAANKHTILNTVGAEAPYWKKTHEVAKYDVFGNVLEELDGSVNRTSNAPQTFGAPTLTGKRTAVQYGYNKSLPTAVANNVQQRSFFYDGFEDYSMLVPKNQYFLYKNTYYHKTPFAQAYQALDMSATKVRNDRYGQDYRQYALVSSGDSITSATAHSGNYSIRFSAARSFTVGGQTRNSESNSLYNLLLNTELFRVDHNRKYVVSFWFKPVSGAATSVLSSIAFAYTNGTVTSFTNTYPFVLKTGSVDGWYKAEFVTPLMHTMRLTLPAGAYFDDIRMIPLDANMKSYVYDPVSFKLTAQLDENNFTTFYEYDQEGLLVRVKKETDRGIQTVSESRRSNSKK